MQRVLPTSLFICIVLLLAGVFLYRPGNLSAENADHVVISEIMLAGESSNDEFVELYNPTDSAVDLTGWSLTKLTASQASSDVLIADIGKMIQPRSFLLFAHADSTASTSADMIFESGTISSNNSVLLKNGETIIDLVGMGTATASESATMSNPSSGKSIERKANASSTSETMSSGGSDEFEGNGEDTDDNSADFVVRDDPEPQNMSSAAEPMVDPTPTATPSATPSPTTEPSPTAAPSPTASPSATPTPTMEPSPTATPSPTPTVTPKPDREYRFFHLTCKRKYKKLRLPGRTIYFPYTTCRVAR